MRLRSIRPRWEYDGDPHPPLARSGGSIGLARASRYRNDPELPLEDASYHAWVRAPGELYRGGYGSSLVIVNANDGSIRGAYPATDHGAARAIIASFYPLHTGEAAGTIGRIAVMFVGLWLATLIVLGALLWLRRIRQNRYHQVSGTGP